MLSLALVGPDSLSTHARVALAAEPRIHLLGSRPYSAVPAYLQHADVVIVPHCVNAFTESLDPIKAYECLAAGRPTVATPVAGFRGLDGAIDVVPREAFVRAVDRALAERRDAAPPPAGIDWEARVAAFESLLPRAAA